MPQFQKQSPTLVLSDLGLQCSCYQCHHFPACLTSLWPDIKVWCQPDACQKVASDCQMAEEHMCIVVKETIHFDCQDDEQPWGPSSGVCIQAAAIAAAFDVPNCCRQQLRLGTMQATLQCLQAAHTAAVCPGNSSCCMTACEQQLSSVPLVMHSSHESLPSTTAWLLLLLSLPQHLLAGPAAQLGLVQQQPTYLLQAAGLIQGCTELVASDGCQCTLCTE